MSTIQPASGNQPSVTQRLETAVQIASDLTQRVAHLAIALFNHVIVPVAKFIWSCLQAIFCTTQSNQLSSRPEIPSELTPHLNEVRDEVMNRYRALNRTATDADRLERQLVMIKVLLSGATAAASLTEQLSLTPEEARVASELATIARAVHGIRNFYPRTNQLLSVLNFLEGKQTTLAQISTGQGKTLIAAMTAILRLKLNQEQVAILTPTEPLALSGMEEMRALYEQCGVTVGCFEPHRFVEGDHNAQVIYTTPFALECDKIAKLKGVRHHLPYWETATEKLARMREALIQAGIPGCEGFL